MTGLQVVACGVCLVAPWLFAITASVKTAGLVGLNTLGVGMVGMVVAISGARMHLLDRGTFPWVVFPSTALALSGLLMFSMAAWMTGFIRAGKERRSG